MAEKLRNAFIVAIVGIITVITLREFGASIRMSVGIFLAWICHVTASDWANYAAIAYYVSQIGVLAWDKAMKKNGG